MPVESSMYEILALRYAGPFEGSGALLMWLRDWDVVAKRCYYIWCIRNEKETIVVDTGVSPERAGEMNLAGYINPAEMLSRIDVDARQVKHVILTHIHWDHASGVRLFPNATFYVQQREFRFWIDDPIAKRPPLARSSDPEAISYLQGGVSIQPKLRAISYQHRLRTYKTLIEACNRFFNSAHFYPAIRRRRRSLSQPLDFLDYCR